MIISVTISSQIFIPNTIAFANIKRQDKNATVKSNAAGLYTDSAMTQKNKGSKRLYLSKESNIKL